VVVIGTHADHEGIMFGMATRNKMVMVTKEMRGGCVG